MDLLTRTARLFGVRGVFEATRFIWSRGLALMCEHHGGHAFVREQRGDRGKPLLRFEPRA